MEQLVNFIIRPPRAEYDPKHDLLDQEFVLKGKPYQRKDVEVKNCRGNILQCSHYLPANLGDKSLPCVVYCHGNSGCRADASEAAVVLLPSNITVFTLDFSGSGLSGGDFVTLGWNEKDDLKAVVDYLRNDRKVSLIGLWGRSMGAVTSLLYGSEDPSIAGIVFDSPFSNLVDLMMELVDVYKVRLPKFTVKFAIQYMRKSIQKKALFDIADLDITKVAETCFVPALFGHAIGDDFIDPHHSDKIFAAYMGEKNIIKFEGDHNSPRPPFYFDSINIFFHNILHPPEEEAMDSFVDTVYDYIDKEKMSAVRIFRSPELSTVSEEPSENIEVTMDQIRSKRCISRMKPGRKTEDKEEGSPSKAISFEILEGNLRDPCATSASNDPFVEYELDAPARFPCNAEEEEKMLMSAIIESLKELQPNDIPSKDAPSNPEKQEPKPMSSPTIMDSETASSCLPITTDGHSTSCENPIPRSPFAPKPDMSGPLSSECHNPSPKPSLSMVPELKLTADSADRSVCSNGAGGGDEHADNADVSNRTRATLTVERDGRARQWDFNFFRGGK